MEGSILLMAILFVVGIFGLPNMAQPQSPTPTIVQLTPGEVKWMTSPSLPGGAQLAVVYGNATKPELYIMLFKLPASWKNPPHSHLVEQVITVLSGTIYSGVGESYDPHKLKMFPAGSVYTDPLNMPHFTETRAEEVILQATGVGPLRTQYVNPADNPRKK
jgi:quercetin dioxygenase-like cupin family protein